MGIKHFLYGLLVLLCVSGPALAEDKDKDKPSTTTNTVVNTVRPAVLSSTDIALYQKIYSLQEEGKWIAADKEIKKLSDDLLMGHVLFQRYMHPTKYRSRYSELAAWMKNYADHPFAWRIYRLANKRKGTARAPKKPIATDYPGVTGQASLKGPTNPKRSKAQLNEISAFRQDFRNNLQRERFSRAERSYWAMDRRGILSKYEQAEILDLLASFYFYNGFDRKAQAYAELGLFYSDQTVPNLYWVAGLSSYRLNEADRAENHFINLYHADRSNNDLKSAGAYWAHRLAYKDQRVEDGITYLKQAAAFQESFYGLIAARQLGIDVRFDWSVPRMHEKDFKRITKEPAARRAIALTEIGRDDIADEELRLLWGRKGVAIQDDITVLATHLKLPAIQLRLGRTGGTKNGQPPFAVRYPLPDWSPAGGFTVDRAFIYAKVHQESAFKSTAQSGPGARGLMQITPATAAVITNDFSLGRFSRAKLYEPEFNMALGQYYINYLEGLDLVDGNLFMLLAAYNAGPGSLQRWREDIDYFDDPLMFIESIPFRETRAHIEIVMSNLWLYRMRLGQETPSLDIIAEGGWPTLERLDPDSDTLLKNIEQNRRSGTLTLNSK